MTGSGSPSHTVQVEQVATAVGRHCLMAITVNVFMPDGLVGSTTSETERIAVS